MEKIRVGVFGATGYTGWTLIQLLLNHPFANIEFITSERMTGKLLSEAWPLAPDFLLQSAVDVNYEQVDCVFLCLPHTHSARIAAKAKSAGVVVIDLSADLRLNTPEAFYDWYQVEHAAPDLLPVVYGLPEQNRDQIRKAKIIANPGCYATSMLLGLIPLARAGLIRKGFPVIVDAKSGTTGAGRNPKQHILFSEVHGNFSPYSIGRKHRHIGEVEQQLSVEGFEEGHLIFSPHLLPTDRGILASIYVSIEDMEKSIEEINQIYEKESFVTVLKKGQLASLAHVVRTPNAVISLTSVDDQTLIIMVAIDNLMKGAASQAVQNFNLVFDFEEISGLNSEIKGVQHA
ncbi:MAG: N-acetyl-gamma-glutamyl-phosphate reductase [Anaerolineaceae bacterium]|nr:N-acetyl-gamma-glutamyl-phosphate reductase [Anaerolineaceae bacterium]